MINDTMPEITAKHRFKLFLLVLQVHNFIYIYHNIVQGAIATHKPVSPTTALLSPSSACATGTCIDARRLVQSLKIKDNFTTRGRNNISSFVPAPPTVELTYRGRGAVVDGYLVCDGRGLGQLFDPVLVVLVRIQALNHSRRNAWSVANPALAPFNFTPTQEFDGGHVAKGLNVSS